MSTTVETIARLIESLELVRRRPAMFAGREPSAVQAFLSGSDLACREHGLWLRHATRQRAAAERGWVAPTAEAWPVSQMRERGFGEAAVADELLAIEILAWRLALNGQLAPPEPADPS